LILSTPLGDLACRCFGATNLFQQTFGNIAGRPQGPIRVRQIEKKVTTAAVAMESAAQAAFAGTLIAGCDAPTDCPTGSAPRQGQR